MNNAGRGGMTERILPFERNAVPFERVTVRMYDLPADMAQAGVEC